VGGGGEEGNVASSIILMCVMYDSNTVEPQVSCCNERAVAWPSEDLTGAVLIPLVKAAVNDSALLILKSLGPAHSPIASIAAVDPARSILR
jgi:hypothetical protein